MNNCREVTELEDSFVGESPEDRVAVNLRGGGVDLNELKIGKGSEFEIDPSLLDPVDDEKTYFDNECVFKQLNYECLNDGYDDDDDQSTPFERIRKGMTAISNDSGVMKHILKHGAGAIVPQNSLCRVHYNAYIEYSDEPFDSSRLRGRQKQFKLGNGEVILGWEIGVATMKRGELARFLFTPQYGFGKSGCPPRVPANATTLFEIELISFVDQGAADEFENFSEEERKQASFDQILKVADSLRLTGNESFSSNQIGRASGKYSQALRLLENTHLKNEKEENQMKKACLKLSLNLSLCDLKLAKSGRACKYARKALDIDPKNIKALYRLARALRQLGEYDDAKRQISKAHRLDPRNKDVTEELHKLDEEMKRYRKTNEALSRKMLNLNIPPKPVAKPKPAAPTNQMVAMISNVAKTFKEDPHQQEMKIPGNLTDDEVMSIQQCAKDLDLFFYEIGGTIKSYCLSKVPDKSD